MESRIEKLLKEYALKKKEIKKRLKEFELLGKNGSDTEIFSELCFCLCTPQSKARACDAAIKELVRRGDIFSGRSFEIASILKKNGVRFPGNKGKFIAEARYHVMRDGLGMEQLISGFKDTERFRDWLVNNIKGFGMKESSHFLRNIGRGRDIAILDRHVLKNLKEFEVIKDVPNLNKKNYLEIEEKMKAFAKKINIPLDGLDLLFWSQETGEIFK